MIEKEEVDRIYAHLSGVSLEEAIGQAVGMASVCWVDIPTGEFNSTRAAAVANALYRRVKEEMANGGSAEEMPLGTST